MEKVWKFILGTPCRLRRLPRAEDRAARMVPMRHLASYPDYGVR